MNPTDPVEWYMEIPIVSRAYLTGAFLTTAACALDVVSPFSLYYNYNAIFFEGEVWRLATNFFFFGMFGIDFIFHMFFLMRYCRLLEENSFRGRTADFICMIAFGAIIMSAMAIFLSVHFLSNSLTFMMLYVWGRRNPYVRMTFFGILTFTAPYLPWVILGFSAMVGNNLVTDLIGIGVGHLYYFFEDVYPIVAEIRGWRIKRWLEAPDFLKSLCGEYRNNINVAAEMAAAALLGEADDENDNNVVNNNQVVPNEE
jgi:Derlin-2/3